MMIVSRVSKSGHCYIDITSSLTAKLVERFAPFSHAVLVSDMNTARFQEGIVSTLAEMGIDVNAVVLPCHGESCKSFQMFETLTRDIFRLSFLRRKSCLVAVGGGSVIDLVGFVAASFQRGVSYMNIPTTLLAMVDASIGGKTAINLPEGKHLLGAFHYPNAVIIDTQTLSTLPARYYTAGFSEVVKVALLKGDSSLFELLELHVESLLAREANLLTRIIEDAIQVKLAFVERDWEERDLDRLLNLGHEIAHAVESRACFNDGLITHGEAVKIGLLCSAYIARNRGLLSQEHYDRITRLLHALIDFSPPTEIVTPEGIVDYLAVVNMIRDGNLRVVLPSNDIGIAHVHHDVSVPELAEALRESTATL